MPGYSVKMGFGLHVGWAIEGAIGSDFKIDVSYLSPNVKLSDELEASTKMFGTSLIFSGFVYDLISPEVKQK
jgi:class 3 adenylate cyclase